MMYGKQKCKILWYGICCSVTKPCLTLHDPMDCSMPGSSVLHCLPQSVQIHVQIHLSIRWPKCWSFCFSISPSVNAQDWFPDRLDLLVVQGTRKCLLQHHNSKASVLRHSAFLMVQLSHLYMTTEKTIVYSLQKKKKKIICWNSKPQYLRMRLYLDIESVKQCVCAKSLQSSDSLWSQGL